MLRASLLVAVLVVLCRCEYSTSGGMGGSGGASGSGGAAVDGSGGSDVDAGTNGTDAAPPGHTPVRQRR